MKLQVISIICESIPVRNYPPLLQENLELKTDVCLQAVFVSPKLAQQLKYQEPKPEIINQQRVVYEFLCPFCTESYVGYTTKHLHERCSQHRNLNSSIGKHLRNNHGTIPKDLSPFFTVIKKCKSKFDCLVFEMLFIRQKKIILKRPIGFD